jgi:rod shape-determining protein MreD
MYLLLLIETMKINHLIVQSLLIWITELLLLDTLEINNIRPDFFIVLVLYWSIKYGRTLGIISGFVIGVLVDLSGAASFFGLSPLIYSITGYLSGNLKGLFNKINPILFVFLWVAIIFIQAFIFCLVHNQYLLAINLSLFYKNWFATGLYTLSFIIVLQIIYPIHKIE